MSHSLDRNYNFYLSLDLEEYAGRWIAILDNKVIAMGNSFKEVFGKASELYPGKRPLFDRVSESTHHFLK